MAKGRNLFVFFDLVHPDDNYDRLSKAITALGGATKIASMLWYVDSAFTPAEAEQVLRPSCNTADTLIVLEAGAAQWVNLPPLSLERVRAAWNIPAAPMPVPTVPEPELALPPPPRPAGEPAAESSSWFGRFFGPNQARPAA